MEGEGNAQHDLDSLGGQFTGPGPQAVVVTAFEQNDPLTPVTQQPSGTDARSTQANHHREWGRRWSWGLGHD
jgi:hypothetical protein